MRESLLSSGRGQGSQILVAGDKDMCGSNLPLERGWVRKSCPEAQGQAEGVELKFALLAILSLIQSL